MARPSRAGRCFPPCYAKPAERRLDGLAADWTHPPGAAPNLIAVACRAGPDALPWSHRGGLPDDAYAHDGQLTKRDVRAATLARLAPLPGERLWDVGAGCGSIPIPWGDSQSPLPCPMSSTDSMPFSALFYPSKDR